MHDIVCMCMLVIKVGYYIYIYTIATDDCRNLPFFVGQLGKPRPFPSCCMAKQPTKKQALLQVDPNSSGFCHEKNESLGRERERGEYIQMP